MSETTNTFGAGLNASALTEFDFIVVIDASGSMGTEDMNGRSRWEHMKETAEAFARDLGKLDGDGIDVVLFNGAQGIKSFQGVTADKVHELFDNNRPMGGTPLAEALQEGLRLAGKSDKKDFIIVFTDGVPDNKEAAAEVIRKASHTIASDEDLTFLFVQVGHDAAATAYLQKLDDDLTGAKFDIVDAVTIAEAEQFPSTAALVLKAIGD